MKPFSKRLPTLIKKFILPSLGVLALVAFSSVLLYEATKSTVAVSINGEEQTVKTHAKTVNELLEDLDVEVGEHDFISMDLEDEIENGTTIEYVEAKRVYVTIDDEKNEHYTTKETVGDLLKEKDLKVTSKDKLSHDSDEEIVDDLHIVIDKAFKVTIDDGGKEKEVWSTGDTVENLLKDNEIDLPTEGLDIIKPSLKDKLNKRQTITITRIKKKIEEVESEIEYKTEKREDSSLAKGKEKTIQNGKNGKLLKKYEITYENGEKVDRKLKEEKTEVKPKNQIIAVGTKVEQPKQNLVTLAKSSSKNEPSGKVMYMSSSAYSANCKGCSGITSTGINLKANPNTKVIAVDPNVIPLGSKVWVEGYGYAVAGDTGGAIKGNRIDIHMPSQSEALRHGVRRVKVIVVK